VSDESTAVSWKVIEPRWKVFSADGNEIGEVDLTVSAAFCPARRRPRALPPLLPHLRRSPHDAQRTTARP
jgi:hypothetical protein